MTPNNPQTAANANAAPEPMFDKLKRGLKTVTIDGETFYIAEGDLLIDESQLPRYAVQRAAAATAPPVAEDAERSTMKAIAVSENGKIVRWKPGMVLSYCVLKRTFGDENNYELVRNNMQRAAWDWEGACGVKFEYRADLDESPTNTPDGVLFPVREVNANGQFIAAAFFPNDAPVRRRLVIDPSYYTTNFDPIGVLRHELGHVLGLRHEHIQSNAPPACQGEDTGDIIKLGDYDPQSVMHYFCGGVGSLTLEITDLDRAGVQKIYGPSFEAMRFYE
ncbi:MAG TPA: hypothetical protein VK308_06385 [Pyrinomonadaceae bacterium]|nr:hypothetical protein [Pyrinomonadaceae bacterium]